MSKQLFALFAMTLLCIACSAIEPQQQTKTPTAKPKVIPMQLSSPAFTHMGMIPKQYTCDGDDINPPLRISGIPAETQSLVLIMDDPDAPKGTWDHWIMWNIPPTSLIPENSAPGEQGMNSWPKKGYGGPCPPSGTHRYFFKLYALDAELDLSATARKAEVEQVMQGHILAEAELIGRYGR